MAGLPGIQKCILGVKTVIVQEKVIEVIDEEWLTLISEAKKLGLSIEEIQSFLHQNDEKVMGEK